MGIGRQKGGGEGRGKERQRRGKEQWMWRAIGSQEGTVLCQGQGWPGILYPAAAGVVLGNSIHRRSAPECGLGKASPSVGEERRGGRQPSQEARAQEKEARAQKGPVGKAGGRLPLWLAPWLL